MLVNAAYWIVNWLSTILEPLTGIESAATAIIVLTIIVRCLLIPVGLSQVRAGITRKRLAPKLEELQKKHKKNPEVLNQKMMELYAEEKASPFAGCLPVLAQMPVLMAVYGIFIQSTIGGQHNTLLDHSLFGVPLGTNLFTLVGDGGLTWVSGGVYLVILGVIAVVATLSRRLLMPETPTTTTQQSAGAIDLSGVTRAMSFMPYLTVAFAAFVPLAAALYLLTTTAWTFGERWVLNRVLDKESRSDSSKETGASK